MTKVKICGLSTKEAVETAVASGADYIGFVFAPSRRQVTIQEAQELAKLVPQGIKKIGVFVSPELKDLKAHISQVPLDLVQIHGDFDEAKIIEVSVPVIRALQVTDKQIAVSQQADYYLFDAPSSGSGQTFDWQQLDTSQLKHPFFIAGGLNVDNVLTAIDQFQPYAVDVSSGVETDGIKDLAKIKQFIESVKA
ncbi:phosphoribosylanthranilate isomerase [Streptococcus dentapri]|uniref:N-(5'-phosphoribosyl)anthranilate isomerase n=1 Tax=Streptococcus dentapri TaxID=573564 RepID=A0ABV8CYV5_9STRE